jgi:hypothetical protein
MYDRQLRCVAHSIIEQKFHNARFGRPPVSSPVGRTAVSAHKLTNIPNMLQRSIRLYNNIRSTKIHSSNKTGIVPRFVIRTLMRSGAGERTRTHTHAPCMNPQNYLLNVGGTEHVPVTASRKSISRK